MWACSKVIMARMAGEVFHQTMTVKEKPIVPGFNSEDLMDTPELTPYGPQRPGTDLDKDRYIRQSPRSGVAQSGSPGMQVAAVPAGLLPKVFIKEAVGGTPTADGTLYKGQPDPFQQNNKIRPADSDDQFMDVMRSGFV